ncbi:MAG: hypothetical protein ACPG52_01425 [Cognaticolwellia sp.]
MYIKTLSLLFVSLVSFNVSAAEKLTVYRWIDKENVVHFSQNQPTHDNYTEISMSNNKNAVAMDNKASSEDSENSDFANSGVENSADDATKDKCTNARNNLETLEEFTKIQYKDENGKLQILSDLEKKQQLEMNKKQVEVYCTQ